MADPPADAAAAATRAASIAILRRAKANATYTSEYKRYKTWCATEELSADDEGRWLTRINLDRYFKEHLALFRAGSNDTLKRVGNALHWYGMHQEWPMEAFTVKDATYEGALKTAIARNKEPRESSTTKKVADPHKGLKIYIHTGR